MNIRSTKKIKQEVSLNQVIGTDKDGNDMELLDILEQQLEDQRRQLAEKDKQIADQSRQISQLLEQLAENAKIINQQQQLTAMNTQFLLGQPAAATGEEVEPPAEEAAPAQEQNAAAAAPVEITPDPPQKIGFFQRIFRKGKK